MCDKTVDAFMSALKFVPDWFVTNKVIEKLDNAVFSNDDIVSGELDSEIVTFFSNNVGLNIINLNNDNLDHDKFDAYDPETINHIRLTAWYNRYKQHKTCKKEISEELMPVAWKALKMVGLVHIRI